ncbi:hypothetical protein D3C72_2526520 [compost metagenome]
MIGHRLAEAPDGTRPIGIALEAGDNVNMDLPHDISKSADIDLVGSGGFFERARHHHLLKGQHGLVEWRHLE